MAKALYRTYRSRSLDDVIGQTHVTDVLKKVIAAKRFSHAYLLTGPRGTGKTSVARILAHAINELPYLEDEAAHLDIIEIDAASNRRIDDIRELRDKVHIAPISAPYKIYIIDEVHMLTSESFNALLKTLEEPPAHVIFILATTELQKLPATIISRTQRYSFRLIAAEVLAKHLRTIADQEKIAIDDDALQLVAEHGDGSARDSVSLLDQLSNLAASTKITAQLIEETLGLAPKEQLEKLTTSLIDGNPAAVRDILRDMEQTGISASMIVSQLMAILTKKAPDHPELYQLLDQLIDVPRAYQPRLKLLTTLLLFVNRTGASDKKAAPLTSSTPVVTLSAIPKKKTPPGPAPTKAVTPAQSVALDTAAWQTIVDHVRTHNPPLFSVLKHGRPHFEQEGSVVVLAFAFGLHARKLDDPKYRTQLGAVITELLGGHPELIIKVDKSLASAPAAPPQPAPPTPPSNSQASSVIAMMGGGEVVDAAKI